MKKLTLTILMSLAMAGSAFAGTVELKSEKGFFDFEGTSNGLTFSLNSSNNQSGVCNLDGVAIPINNTNSQEKTYVWSDPIRTGDAQCTMLMTFISDEHVKISTTEPCNNFCGLDAAGSIDGDYVK